MLAPVLVVFIASAGVDREPDSALIDAASQALGPGAGVVIERYAQTPPDEAALAAAARARGALGAARVIWREPDRRRAELAMYLTRGNRMVHRALEFQPRDAAAERARAVGLVLASLVADPGPSEAAPASPAGEAAEHPHPASPASSVGARPGPPAQEAAVADARPVGASPPAPLGRWGLEGFADGGLSLGGQGSGFGGGVAGRLHGPPGWGARLGLHARAGSVPAAQASSLAVALSAGGFRGLYRAAPTSAWDVGVRAELLLLYEALTHFSSDDPAPVRRARLLPGAAALLEAHGRLSQSAGLHVAAGLETAFGTTHVTVRGLEVAKLAPVRAVLEAGLRARF